MAGRGMQTECAVVGALTGEYGRACEYDLLFTGAVSWRDAVAAAHRHATRLAPTSARFVFVVTLRLFFVVRYVMSCALQRS